MLLQRELFRRRGLVFANAFRIVPQPKAAQGKQHEADGRKGRVAEFQLFVGGFEQKVEDGSVVYFFDNVGIALSHRENFARRAIELKFGKMLSEHHLSRSLRRANINPVYFGRFLQRIL